MEYKNITPEIEAVSHAYQGAYTPEFLVQIQNFLYELWRLFIVWLNSLQGPEAGPVDSTPLSNFLQILLYLAGAVGLVALIFIATKRWQNIRKIQKNAVHGASAIEKISDFQSLKIEAQIYAKKGDFKLACRALYLSLLQLLHESKIVQFAPTKTNYEYTYMLAAKPLMKERFKQIANLIELVWFGDREAGKDDYDLCLQLVVAAENDLREIRP
ncbi:MAG: DUF4129 domain-containing protein [Candidatus Obscuribacterales bacterium]|nr:DUF4129 domain-containing protein [Candidatus Obscuribacterales bacterium]